jgi:hypothetical protein
MQNSSVPRTRASAAPRWTTCQWLLATAAALLLPLVLGACGSTSHTASGPGAEVRALTGAHTRVVWVQGDGTDPFAFGDDLVLMGFDTDDGQGERVVLGERSSYVKPMLTPRGDRIVFSTQPVPGGPDVFIVNWDGSGLKRIARGFALTLWQDRVGGAEWLYLGTDNSEEKPWEFATVTRFRLDDPDTRELVWNRTVVSGDTFQVSTDGRFGGGLFPWPTAGVAELPNGSLRTLGEGCWTALTTARTPLFWYFDGAHRNLIMVDTETEARWTVSVNSAPGFGNAEVYHPRWTNHPRFLAISGPYNQGGDNQVRSGGAQAEVYLGRFSEDFTRVEAWARVTHNTGGDSYPDVWIDRNDSPFPRRPQGAIGPVTPGGKPGASSAAGAEPSRVVVEARLVRAGPVPSPRSIEPYRSALVVSDYEVLEVVEGQYDGSTMLVAQWAIRDAQVLASAQRRPGSVHRLILERYDAHPELEGERLIAASDAPDLPVYYDVES